MAKTKKAYDFLTKKFKDREVTKKYIAICFGWPKKERGEMKSFLARHNSDRKRMSEVDERRGKLAISKYSTLETYKSGKNDKISKIEFEIKTGRTHQIRVHAKSLKIPILGDSKYFTKQSKIASSEMNIDRQLLHATELKIKLPSINRASSFNSQLPKDMQDCIGKLTTFR